MHADTLATLGAMIYFNDGLCKPPMKLDMDEYWYSTALYECNYLYIP